MPSVSIKAHFDGKRIVLDEPFDIAPNAPLLVTILADDERSGWTTLSAQSLARAYGDNEPDYSTSDVKSS